MITFKLNTNVVDAFENDFDFAKKETLSTLQILSHRMKHEAEDFIKT